MTSSRKSKNPRRRPVKFFLGYFFVFLGKFSGKNIVDLFLGGGEILGTFF